MIVYDSIVLSLLILCMHYAIPSPGLMLIMALPCSCALLSTLCARQKWWYHGWTLGRIKADSFLRLWNSFLIGLQKVCGVSGSSSRCNLPVLSAGLPLVSGHINILNCLVLKKHMEKCMIGTCMYPTSGGSFSIDS